MKLTDLKKQLNSMEKNKLIALICKLYKASKQAQSLIDVELCGDTAEEQLVTECKKRIHAAFFRQQTVTEKCQNRNQRFEEGIPEQRKHRRADALLRRMRR